MNRWRAAAPPVGLLVLAGWLCGNLYEEIVIVPNLLGGDVHASMLAFRAFFQTSNPAYYYAPLVPLIVATSVVNVVASRRRPSSLRAALGAAACVLAALLLTAWIVVHVNLQLFFGPVLGDLAEARSLALQWLLLNALRVGLVGMAIGFVVRLLRDGGAIGTN